MPIVSDQELEEFNKKSETLSRIIDEHEDLKEDHEELQESYNALIKRRNLFVTLTIVFGVLLFIGVLLKFLKPNLFVNKSDLQKSGYELVEKEAYEKLQSYAADKKDAKVAKMQDELNGVGSDLSDTLIYAVQIGAFADNDIQLYSESFVQFNQFKEGDFYKYTLGAFETLKEAQDFRKKVIGLGFKDTFVASYQNGKRVKIELPN